MDQNPPGHDREVCKKVLLFEWLLWMMNKIFEDSVPQDLTGGIFYAPVSKKFVNEGGVKIKSHISC